MKIAIITSGFLPVIDGVTVSGWNRIQKLSEWGHQVLLFCPDYSAIASIYPNWQDFTGNILPGVRVVNLKSTPFFVEFERNVAFYSYSKLQDELEKFKPDIIHVDEPERLFVGFWRIAGKDYAKKHYIPCISFFRTNFLEYLEDFFPLPTALLNFLKYIVRKLILFVYNSYDLTLVTSKITEPKIKDIGIKNICYSNLLGFDSSKYNLQLRQTNFFKTNYNLPELDNKIKLVFLGRLTPDKGWSFTLKTFPKLFQTIDKNKIAILIIGDGEMKTEICQTISQFTPHFYCFGRVVPEEIPLLLVNSDFHVTTSEKETRGLTVLEAFAANIPVLAPRAGGVVENIQDGINGFLFTPQDQDDFIHKLKILVENQSLRQQMGIQGRKSVIGKYSWEQAVTNLLNIWEEQIIRYQNIIVDG
ncbi:glycosyl transferase group 1 [Stanieria cyanosphaera PCC 7437]|uniref:Glycosyl transferase group 1 n=1 Tax=Stanieria cyanosphaera (strain ATCC 29371 / PCC 7437) TaxID=111780 RepID=K9XMR2_STAC7|nr:glycosyltransferase [Stanieria cyanosphaera]AFZ33890.1 glycosyl transferase group 1 [Stanieria cyanosphaera PCC 7437]